MISEGVLLGLSTGVMCLAYCGPILIPYLLSEGKNVRQSVFSLFIFLFGRMLAYIIIGFFAGLLGQTFIQPSEITTSIIGIIYIFLAILLILYGFYRFKEICLGHIQHKINSKFQNKFPLLVPLIGGIVTGLNICPPFLIAITKAADTGSIVLGIVFFLMFFMGSAIYFIPLPFIGLINKKRTLRMIGKYAAILTGAIFLFKGTFMILN